MQAERGKFIVLEGPGGSGKSTQIPLILNYLALNHIDAHSTREPGGSEAAEDIRELIFSLRDKGIIAANEQIALFFAARYLWLNEVVIPKLDAGKTIVTDRTYPSTAAYQGYAEGGSLESVLNLTKEILGEYLPDAIIYLDIKPETKETRKTDLGGDPFDKQKIEYTNRVIDGYREMARTNWSGVPWYVINGEQAIEDVHESIKIVLNGIFNI